MKKQERKIDDLQLAFLKYDHATNSLANSQEVFDWHTNYNTRLKELIIINISKQKRQKNPDTTKQVIPLKLVFHPKFSM